MAEIVDKFSFLAWFGDYQHTKRELDSHIPVCYIYDVGRIAQVVRHNKLLAHSDLDEVLHHSLQTPVSHLNQAYWALEAAYALPFRGYEQKLPAGMSPRERLVQVPLEGIKAARQAPTPTAEERLQQANATVAQLSTALAEAKEEQQALLQLAQLRAVKKAHANLYGPDPITGQTAAQEYSAFKQAQREQQSK